MGLYPRYGDVLHLVDPDTKRLSFTETPNLHLLTNLAKANDDEFHDGVHKLPSALAVVR